MVRPSSINTMTTERAKKAPKIHRIRDRPILWVFRKTMDAEVKIPDPIQRTPVRRPILRPAESFWTYQSYGWRSSRGSSNTQNEPTPWALSKRFVTGFVLLPQALAGHLDPNQDSILG